MTDKGLLTCLDALTGQMQYEGGRVPVPATFTASPVAYGDRLLLTSEDGDTFVIKAGPTHRGARHQLDRRAGLRVAGAGRRRDLHPRREAPVRDRRVVTEQRSAKR